jgi:hypothetical protein
VIEPTSAPLLFPFENKDGWLALIGRALCLSYRPMVRRKLEVVSALELALQLVRQFRGGDRLSGVRRTACQSSHSLLNSRNPSRRTSGFY